MTNETDVKQEENLSSDSKTAERLVETPVPPLGTPEADAVEVIAGIFESGLDALR